MNKIDKQEIIEQIREELRVVKPKFDTELADTAHLVNDGGMESLDIVELVARIEARFRIPIDDDQYRKMMSVDEIANYILMQKSGVIA